MAKAKKVSKSAAKKPKRAAPRRARKAPVRLTAADRAAKLKPGDSLNELIDEVLTAWALVGRKVRVHDVTAARLRSLAKRAIKASQRENDLAAKQADRLAPLTDARMVAQDLAYRDALKVKRIADAIAQTDQAVADAFSAVRDRFRPPSAPVQPSPPAKPGG